ncbi:MAG TPA: hypothetical protein VHO03_05975 [Ignavibacteriales bacterium]|nr:hypothetical protein [Ignavibacteriales bacterium]
MFSIGVAAMLRRSLWFIIVLFSFSLIFYYGCRTAEPTVPVEYNPAVSDTLKLQAVDSTLNSIKLRLTSSSREAGSRKVRLYRMANDTTSPGTLLSEYPIGNKDTVILDNNAGAGLLMGSGYKYRAMIVDKLKGKEYLRQEVTARTLSLTGDDYSWTEYTFGEFQSGLEAVWAVNENDVYAFGFIVKDGQTYGGLHFNGSKWELIKDAGGYSVFGFSANDVWAAGGGLFHYDGNKWTGLGERVEGDHVVPIDSVIFTHGAYLAIWGTSSSNLYLGDTRGYIVHWDGKKAHMEDIKASVPICDMWGVSANEIYAAAGSYVAGIGELFRFDGQKWTMIKKGVVYPGPGELKEPFMTVWTYNGEEIITAGNYVARGTAGDSWKEGGIGFFVNRIRGDKPNNIFASGDFGNIAHFNGKQWTMLNAGISTNASIVGMFVKDDYVYDVGYDGYKAYIYHGKRKK